MLRERSRSRTVERLGILDMSAEPGIERIVEQAADAFAAPFAMVTLLHDRELRILASSGLAAGCVPRRDSFCTHAVDRAELLEVCDARADPRFCDLPGVTGAPHVRYYIGAPLTLTGTDIGVLCVVDTSPRPPASADQRAYLAGLARQATGVLERHAHVLGGLAA